MKSAAAQVLRAGLFFTCLSAAGAALAHAHLENPQPGVDAQVTVSPQALLLNFSEGIEEKFSGVTLSAEDGTPVATGPATRSEKEGTRLTVPVKRMLQPGLYTVSWHVVSVDGHKTQGQYHFTVK